MDLELEEEEEERGAGERWGVGERAARFSRRLLILAVAAIATATLTPAGGERATAFTLCIVCGYNGSADAVRNIILFLPLGLALGGLISRRRHAVLLGFSLSLTVELLQFLVPGRDPSLSDLVFNSIGTSLGVRLTHAATLWLAPSPRQALRLTLLALGLALGGIALGPYLFGLGLPSHPRETYFGQWTPKFGHLEHYGGSLLSAEVGGVPTPSTELDDTEEIKSLLYAGAPIRVRGIAGPPIEGTAPIFSIQTSWRREVVFLGVEDDDAVFRYSTRAGRALFERPELRVVDAFLGVEEGESLHYLVRREGNGFCIEVNERVECGVGYTVGDVGSLVVYFSSRPLWQRRLIALTILAALFAPTGFWLHSLRGSGGTHAGVAPGPILGLLVVNTVGLALIPSSIGLLPTLGAEYLAMIGGTILGWVAGPLTRRVYRRQIDQRRTDQRARK